MTEKELDIYVRRWLDHTLKVGSYDTGTLISLKQLYHKGRSDVQDEVKTALNIKECFCED